MLLSSQSSFLKLSYHLYGDYVAQACFVVLVVLAYFLLFAPSVRRLNSELRNCRTALLLFPDEVVSGIPALRNLMKEMSKLK